MLRSIKRTQSSPSTRFFRVVLWRDTSVGVHHLVIIHVAPFPAPVVVPEKDRHRADVAHIPVVLLRLFGPLDVVVEGVRPLDGVENSL